MSEIVKRYSSGGITVIWKPALCQHGGICARELPTVFNPRRRPWIQLEYVDPATVTAQVDRCPSGALSWERDP